MLLFFPNTPIHLAEDGSPQVNADPTARLFVWLIRKLSREVGNGRVILAAETESMVAALTNVTGVKFTYLPHPVRLPVGRDDPNLDSIRKVPLLGAYGAARHEKGSDILQTAIRSVLAENSEFGAAFTMQWLDDFEDEGGRWVSKDEYLQRQPKFRFIQEYFKEGGYMEQVSRTSVMMLPYRDNYALRVSRVVIEAMIMGIPVIATEGTTLHQQAQKFGVCVSCRDGCVDSLKNAIEEAVEGLEQLQARAVEKADAARDHFSVKNFRRLLIEAIPDLD
ncbi:MAG: glycosyltransferase [Verrucomicrobiota bacterium]